MQITILLFATLKDIAGQSKLTLALADGPATVADVRRALVAEYPELAANVEAAIAAVNEEYAFNEEPVQDGDSIAFFPPVSGGSDDFPEIFRLADGPIDHDEIIAAISVPATGAVCVFSGMVRGQTSKAGEVQETQHLEYEAYEPMAIAKMRQVAAEIRERWPLVQGIAMIQRTPGMVGRPRFRPPRSGMLRGSALWDRPAEGSRSGLEEGSRAGWVVVG